MIGTSVDRYEILEELGHGGMSVVYRGLDSSLEREVAVKVLHTHLAKKLENRQRFHREAKAIARLRHPNILEVYDFSSEDAERSYIVMEYIAGENLRQFIGRTGTPPPEVAALTGTEICNALEHAHDHGIIHRDLKPENVMVSSAGELKLMDFGIAHVIDAETMTATGSLMGSPAHMAPELIDGIKVDVRADVFALGTVLYWLATGVLPFDGANAPQVLRKVLQGEYDDPELVEPKVGARLGAIIRCCLSHDPDDRYPTVAAARKELDAFAAALGLTESVFEVKKYFKNPDQYRNDFDETVVERLTTQARQAQRERNVPRAISLFNRILAYDPENREVQRLLDRLCRQARWRRAAPWALLGIACIAAVVVTVRNLPPEPVAVAPPIKIVVPPPIGVDEAAALVSNSKDAAWKALIASRVASVGAAKRQVDFAHRFGLRDSVTSALQPLKVRHSPLPIAIAVAPPAADMGTADAGTVEASKTFRWRFSVFPAAAMFKIDGKRVSTLEAAAGVPLTEGIHMLSARGAGTRPWSRRINVRNRKVLPVRVVLDWDEGKVQVTSNVPAVVWFDGKGPKVIGRRHTFAVPFGKADSTENKKQITLRVAPADNVTQVKTRTVTVRPGGTSPVNVDLNPVP